MFRITRKADYAVFILSYLARRTAEEGRDALVSAQELASFSSLNKSLVANLLKDLTRAGFLGSVRGARGGYRLARTAREISLAQILQAVEGPFSFVECAQEHGVRAGEIEADSTVTDHDSCNLAGLCQSKGPLLVLHMRIQHLLDDLTLSELAGIDQPTGVGRIPAEMFPSRATAPATPAPQTTGADRNGAPSRPPTALRPSATPNTSPEESRR